MKYTERILSSDLCDKCPARTGSIMTSQIRGSSYRGRTISEGDNPAVDGCFIMVGNTLVAEVAIANELGETAATEHDADFIYAEFERIAPTCKKPTIELAERGLVTFCTPATLAVNEFIKVNYGE